MAGWSKAKRNAFEESFHLFLKNAYINSKDKGARTCLGDNLYAAQLAFFKNVFDGLEDDIHKYKCLKSRQLGMSTATRALSVFWLGMHDGLSGAMVMDTAFNKTQGRREIESIIDNLPPRLGFPKIKSRNRDGLTLMNDSTLMFISAGIKQSKGSGTLGRSVGLSFAHRSELCSYDNDEGLIAFDQSLSEDNPDRLYIDESTARGPNIWKDIWEDAKSDVNHTRCMFFGWWSKETQIIKRKDPDFERYGAQPPTDREIKKMQEVYDLYHYKITPEQLAWIRRKMDPTAEAEGDAVAEYEGDTTRLQEQPWTEEDSWQVTGSVFFAPEDLTAQWDKHVNKNFKTYMFQPGLEFVDMKVHPAANQRSIELKVWKEPEADATYVVAADVAFGYDEYNDRSAIQVCRCFADGLDQEAEYAWALVHTRGFAWVVLAIAAWYASLGGDVYLIIELNGPGAAVWDEINHVRAHIASGYQNKQIAEKGLKDVFNNVKNYVYFRQDSMAGGRSWQWKTSPGMGPSSKVRIMERLRDFISNGMLHVRSIATVEEMKSVTRDGDTIKAAGHAKDDRVVSLALAIRCWEDRVRRALSAQRRTREVEHARKRLSVVDQVALFQTNMLESFFKTKRVQRARESREITKARWRYR